MDGSDSETDQPTLRPGYRGHITLDNLSLDETSALGSDDGQRSKDLGASDSSVINPSTSTDDQVTSSFQDHDDSVDDDISVELHRLSLRAAVSSFHGQGQEGESILYNDMDMGTVLSLRAEDAPPIPFSSRTPASPTPFTSDRSEPTPAAFRNQRSKSRMPSNVVSASHDNQKDMLTAINARLECLVRCAKQPEFENRLRELDEDLHILLPSIREARPHPSTRQHWHNRGGFFLDLPLAYFLHHRHMVIAGKDVNIQQLKDYLEMARTYKNTMSTVAAFQAQYGETITWRPRDGSVGIWAKQQRKQNHSAQ
ncbi:hypothetical protein BD324DRAFT_640073 [Kockovaella imperatae]|uniref:Uncharacterized protein n=1 Tax=Kockovaella imperatae TaxID=4999 RepID=A0A1Y1U8A3_9TREE|nr:hypothetical protein BD324DRAFT_640073 [Kockovaella imperatae]ORX33345.1 hypothetical protein BD324DRAFT_640073 [Kockovaella imperatae]